MPKLHGYCVECRKVKRVEAPAHVLARGGVPTGICDNCEQDQQLRIHESRGGTFLVMGRSGPLGTGLTLNGARDLARVSGGVVRAERNRR